MIFVHDKIYAKVWKIDKQEKYMDLQVTTSEKQENGEWKNSGWFPRLIGHAFNSLKDVLKTGDKVIFSKSKFTNERYVDKEGNRKSAFRFLVFEAEIEPPKDAPVAPQAEITNTANNESVDTARAEEECPW